MLTVESREFNSSDDGGQRGLQGCVTELAHIVDETLAANNLDRSNWTGWFRIRLTCVLSVQRRKTRHVDGQCRGDAGSPR